MFPLILPTHITLTWFGQQLVYSEAIFCSGPESPLTSLLKVNVNSPETRLQLSILINQTFYYSRKVGPSSSAWLVHDSCNDRFHILRSTYDLATIITTISYTIHSLVIPDTYSTFVNFDSVHWLRNTGLHQTRVALYITRSASYLVSIRLHYLAIDLIDGPSMF